MNELEQISHYGLLVMAKRQLKIKITKTNSIKVAIGYE